MPIQSDIARTRQYIRRRYTLAMVVIVIIAAASALISWSLDKRYQEVTQDFELMTRLSSQATNATHKLYQAMSLQPEKRRPYITSTSNTLKRMQRSVDELEQSMDRNYSDHLAALSNPLVNGFDKLQQFIAFAEKAVESAKSGDESQGDTYRFFTYGTSKFSEVVGLIGRAAAKEQHRLSWLTLIASVVSSSMLTLLVMLLIFLVFLPMENRIVSTHKELTEEREKARAAQAENEYHARHDPLTHLPNRRALDEIMQLDEETPRRGYTVIRIDLDFFKQVNDTHGHEAGDFVLETVADILRCNKRADDLCTRVGGDEFVVVLDEDSNASHAKKFSERVLQQIAKPMVYQGVLLKVGASFGIATTLNDYCSREEVIQLADDALYSAKELGRNQIVTHSLMLEQEKQKRQKMIDELRDAVKKQSFIPYFQPEICIETGMLTGVEVFARWVDSSNKLIMPEVFFSLAHQASLHEEIDRIIYDKACEQIESILAKDLVIPKLAFNVTSERIMQVAATNLVKFRRGKRPNIAFELSEAVVADQDKTAFLKCVDGCRNKGLGIEIGQFGAGETSFLTLTQLKPEVIRVNRPLIHAARTEAKSREILRNIVQMAHILKIKAIAMGVETERDAHMLHGLGFDGLQGNHISEPIDIDGLENFLRDRVTYQNWAKKAG